jgi:hypothetical protein
MRRIPYLILLIGIFLLAMTACSNTLQTADEAGGSRQTAISRDAGTQAPSDGEAAMQASSESTRTQRDGEGAGNKAATADEAGGGEAGASTEAGIQAVDGKAGVVAGKAGSAGGKSTGVVAESGNTVSGEDNGEVMKELEKELDALFTSINRLEDVSGDELTGKEDAE